MYFEDKIHCIIDNVIISDFLNVTSNCFKFNKIIININYFSNPNHKSNILENLSKKNKLGFQTIHININMNKGYKISLKKCLKLQELIVNSTKHCVELDTSKFIGTERLKSLSFKNIVLEIFFINILKKLNQLKIFKYTNDSKNVDNVKIIFVNLNLVKETIEELYLDFRSISSKYMLIMKN